jgi:hypothetical protein
MTTMEVQTAISPATLLRMYRAQAMQDMYGGSAYATGRGQLRSFEAPTSGYRVGGAADSYGYVNIPLVVDQSAAANKVPPLDWYPQQYVSSSDVLAKKNAEYDGFKAQWIRATLSQYK